MSCSRPSEQIPPPDSHARRHGHHRIPCDGRGCRDPAPDCAAYQIDRRAQNKIRAAYIAFLFFAMCAGFDSALRALPFLSQKEKELVADEPISRKLRDSLQNQ